MLYYYHASTASSSNKAPLKSECYSMYFVLGCLGELTKSKGKITKQVDLYPFFNFFYIL